MMVNKKSLTTALIMIVCSSHLFSQDIEGSRPSFKFPDPLINNLERAVVDGSINVRDADEIILFTTIEGDQDLNGDGDTGDRVPQYINSQGDLVTIPYAVPNDNGCGLIPRLSGEHIVFAVSESGQFGNSLNGDGDILDQVLHVHSIETGITLNLFFAVSSIKFDSDISATSSRGFAFTVDENEQGNIDLNGNGFSIDSVVLYRRFSGLTNNIGLAGSTISFFCEDTYDVNNKHIVISALESFQGDLNNDGDTDDSVLHIHEIDFGTTLNTGLSGEFLLGENYIVFSIDENLSDADLNQDGDKNDSVIHIYRNGTLTNLGLAGEIDGFSATTNTRKNKVLFHVNEGDQGNSDINNDGDSNDSIIHAFNLTSGLVENLNVPSDNFTRKIEMHQSVIIQFESESTTGADLNGDGDNLDKVVVAINTTAGLVKTILPFAADKFLVDNRFIAISVKEAEQGQTDLNGNGSTNNTVLLAGDLSTGIINLIEGSHINNDTYTLNKNRVTFLSNEGGFPLPGITTVDLNGDGDTSDHILHVYDIEVQKKYNLQLAVNWNSSFNFNVLDGNFLGIAISEAKQGAQDLNLDGDISDQILHSIKMPLEPQ